MLCRKEAASGEYQTRQIGLNKRGKFYINRIRAPTKSETQRQDGERQGGRKTLDERRALEKYPKKALTRRSLRVTAGKNLEMVAVNPKSQKNIGACTMPTIYRKTVKSESARRKF